MTILEALPVDEKRDLGIAETTLAKIRNCLLLWGAGGLYGGATGTELAHRVVHTRRRSARCGASSRVERAENLGLADRSALATVFS